MSDQYYEIFYFRIIVIFWVIVPAIIGIFLFFYFNRLTNAYLSHKRESKKATWCVKWGYRWNGTPYIKDEGWGPDYSKLSKEEYFNNLSNNPIDTTNTRVLVSRVYISSLRYDIDKYKRITGNYPETLAVMQAYGRQHPETSISAKGYKEYVSGSDEGISDEYNSLNGKGGWYYDNVTGNVKVNLMKPLEGYESVWEEL